MSKVAFIMDKPNCCGECEMPGTGVCRKWNRKDLRTFPKDCPLKDIPQKMAEENRWFSVEYAHGFNACIDAILKEVTDNEIPYQGDNIQAHD